MCVCVCVCVYTYVLPPLLLLGLTRTNLRHPPTFCPEGVTVFDVKVNEPKVNCINKHNHTVPVLFH